MREKPCPRCQAKEGEDCTGVTNVHMGRVPDGWDSLNFILDHLNGFEYIPGRCRTNEYKRFWKQKETT